MTVKIKHFLLQTECLLSKIIQTNVVESANISPIINFFKLDAVFYSGKIVLVDEVDAGRECLEVVDVGEGVVDACHIFLRV